MTIATGRTTRVIGWYHSHPHITVLPSHVDVRTQAMYQLLDPGFVGLIYSCFSEDADKVGRIQVLAFQATDGKPSSTPTEKSVVLAKEDYSVINVESTFSCSDSSGTTSRSKVGGRASDFDAFFVNNTEANITGGDGTSGNYSSVAEIDSMDMSESMQEAMLRSNLETSGGGYVRKEVPLHIVPTSSIIQLEHPLASYVNLQQVLFDEEKAAYRQAVQQSTRDGKVHPLAFIHHTSTYQATLCKMMEHCLIPAINVLEDRQRENMIRLKLLEAEELEAQERILAETSGGEPSSSVQSTGSTRTLN